ncbi:MAG: hypothetical protein L6R45_32445 [Anaerolineae bacterium]|nr:hypothetical protein [Anaerolineae bacterium]
MYDAQLSNLISTALARLQSEMAGAAPVMTQHVTRWMEHLAGSIPPEHYFKHPQAFPSLLLPWWLEKSLREMPDLDFQADLVYSTINGYYAIRLADNLMDGHATVEYQLLPALNFFQTEFQAAYQPYFAAGHPFWDFFRAAWFHSAEVTLQDALLTELDAVQFEQIAAQKTSAARIPLAAVCHRCGRIDRLEPWSRLVDLLGCWHQFLNDLFGWHRDDARRTATYFLSEAERRRRPNEPVLSWVAREGFGWGIEQAQGWMSALQALAQELESPELVAYLEAREEMLQRQATETSAGLVALRKLASVGKEWTAI